VAIFKLDLSHLFSSIVTDANAATLLFGKANSYVLVAEQIGKAWGLTGPQKLEAVKDMLLADFRQSWPAGADWVDKEWGAIGGAISAMVSIFNAIGWLFQAAAPIVSAADPAAAPAINAINAAIQAAQAIGQANQVVGQAQAA